MKNLFLWCMGVGIIFTFVYLLYGEGMVRLMTSDEGVIADSRPFHVWLVAMPLLSCAAFIWDGIFVGATAGRQVRNCMMLSALGFVLSYVCFAPLVDIQAVYIAYFVHLIVRALYLSVRWRRVLNRCVPLCIGLFLFANASHVNAQDRVVNYQPVDSAYMAEVEAIMMEIGLRQRQALSDSVAQAQLHYEQTFHSEGLNLLLRGLFSMTKDRHFRNGMPVPMRTYHCDVTDYAVAAAPLGLTWGLKALGVESRSTTRRLTLANAMALGMTYGAVRSLKSSTGELRPNGRNSHSMPSGHAALAFAGATVLHREYGYVSPWVSVGGYACATATQYLRLRHNEHWLTDLYVGAGMGVMLTNLAYYLTDRIMGPDALHRPRLNSHDLNRKAEFLHSSSGFSLMAGPEYGSEPKLQTSTMFSSGLSYSHALNPYIGLEIMGRLSTASCFQSSGTQSGSVDACHLNGGVIWMVPVAEMLRIGAHAYGGARMLDAPLVGVDNDIRAEVGAGIIIDMLQQEKYSVGVGCDYSHCFSRWFRNRWNINMMWRVFM